ncbi:hypothetical protein HOY80DRAFT_1091648 [Tuber brumale]|nr:hypothetical protein HOY80DRAFT_1091648 [Tuber brumale]
MLNLPEWLESPNPKALARNPTIKKGIRPENTGKSEPTAPRSRNTAGCLPTMPLMTVGATGSADDQECRPLEEACEGPLGPILFLQLGILYLIILAGYTPLSLVGLVHSTAVWLWTTDDIAESGGHARGGLAKTMQFLIVKETLPSQKNKIDEGKQEATKAPHPI